MKSSLFYFTFLLILVTSCSNQEQDVTILDETNFISLKSDDYNLSEFYMSYYSRGNSILVYNSDSQQIKQFELIDNKLELTNKTSILYTFDKTQALQYALFETILLVFYPDSILFYNFNKNLLVDKIEHFGFSKQSENFPYSHNINFKPYFINNKFYLEGYNSRCEDYPTDCNPYKTIWEYNIISKDLINAPLEFHEEFYSNYLKYQNNVNSIWSNDTMFYITSTNATIEAFSILNYKKYSNNFISEKKNQIKVTEEDYYENLMEKVSFGNLYSDLQINKKNNKLYLMYLTEIPKYDEDGLLNYQKDREKYVLEFDKNLNVTNKFKIPSTFSSKFFVVNDGLIFFKTDDEKITSTILYPL